MDGEAPFRAFAGQPPSVLLVHDGDDVRPTLANGS
jgi:hypothetical protein